LTSVAFDKMRQQFEQSEKDAYVTAEWQRETHP